MYNKEKVCVCVCVGMVNIESIIIHPFLSPFKYTHAHTHAYTRTHACAVLGRG